MLAAFYRAARTTRTEHAASCARRSLRLPDGSPLESLVADPAAADPEYEALEHERRELLTAAVARLPERKRIVVTAHWGLDGVPQRTATLAAERALSPRRTQTIGADALYELRDALEPLAVTAALTRAGSRRAGSSPRRRG